VSSLNHGTNTLKSTKLQGVKGVIRLYRHPLLPSGRLRSSPEEYSQYRGCYDVLEEISEFVERLILTTEQSLAEEKEEEEREEVLQQMKTVRDSVGKIFRKLELE